jgi:hypothetical protein
VEGTDSKWVNGNIKAIDEIIESFAPQNLRVLELKWLIHTVLALGIGRLYLFFVGLIPMPSSKPPQWDWMVGLYHFVLGHPLLPYVVLYVAYYLGGFWPAWYFYSKLLSFWPSVELQIGPEHTLIEKRRRRWLFSFFLLGVAPLLTSLVYDFLRPAFFSH